MKSVVVIAVMLVGCTRWATTEVVGPPREVGRRLVGTPQIEETTSSSLAVGLGGASHTNGVGTTVAMGGLSGAHETVKRTHCVQPAEIEYTQQIDYTAHAEHRAGDLVPSAIIAGIGALVLVSTIQKANDPYRYDSDPAGSLTTAYAVGGGMMLVGGGWFVASLALLPAGPAPAVAPQHKGWTETTYVETTGCGLPGERAITTN